MKTFFSLSFLLLFALSLNAQNTSLKKSWKKTTPLQTIKANLVCRQNIGEFIVVGGIDPIEQGTPIKTLVNSFFIQKIDGEGNIFWTKEIYPYQTEEDPKNINLTSLFVTDEGKIVVAGYHNSGNLKDHSFIYKLNQDGTLEWYKEYYASQFEKDVLESADHFRLKHLTQGDDGNWVGVGVIGKNYIGSRMTIVEFQSDGNISEQKVIGEANIIDSEGYRIERFGAIGYVIMARLGFFTNGSSKDYLLVSRIDNNLNTVWSKKIELEGSYTLPVDMIQNNLSEIIVLVTPEDTEFSIYKFTPNGTFSDFHYKTSDSSQKIYLEALGLDIQNYIYVTGSSENSVLFKLDLSSSLQSSLKYAITYPNYFMDHTFDIIHVVDYFSGNYDDNLLLLGNSTSNGLFHDPQLIKVKASNGTLENCETSDFSIEPISKEPEVLTAELVKKSMLLSIHENNASVEEMEIEESYCDQLEDIDPLEGNDFDINKQRTLKSKSTIFPNPNNGNFKIELADDFLMEEDVQIQIFNAVGKLIHQQHINDTEVEYYNSPTGMYWVKIQTEKQMESHKLMVK